jgi:hypothetical protein
MKYRKYQFAVAGFIVIIIFSIVCFIFVTSNRPSRQDRTKMESAIGAEMDRLIPLVEQHESGKSNTVQKYSYDFSIEEFGKYNEHERYWPVKVTYTLYGKIQRQDGTWRDFPPQMYKGRKFRLYETDFGWRAEKMPGDD